MVQSSPDNLIGLLHQHQADIAICTERLADDDKLIVRPCYQWHHVAVFPPDHPLVEGELTLERLTQFPILTYTPGFTGRSAIERAFADADLKPDIVLAAADSDVIKTYVRLGLGVGIIAGTAYESNKDADLVARDLGHLIPSLVTKIAYLKQLFLPSYCRFFIDELLQEAQRKKS
jgi:DNA-binding transcriptional LysR family regulator